MSKEPSCAKQYTTPVTTESIVTAPITRCKTWSSMSRLAHPMSRPRLRGGYLHTERLPVLAARAGSANRAPLKVLNEDQTSHNIHPLAKVNREWNNPSRRGRRRSRRDLTSKIHPVKCNVHPGARLLAVLKTSHYSITGDNGSFSLPNLPAGSTRSPPGRRLRHTNSGRDHHGSETKTVDFTFKAKPY